MRFALFFVLIADLLTIALVGFDIFLWVEWMANRNNLNEGYALKCLIAASFILLYLALGRYFYRSVLGKKQDREHGPDDERSQDFEKLTRADGTIIHIEHCGQRGKPAIVFIHGWNSNSSQWYYQKKYFSKNYHLIFMDLPGLGQSTKAANKDYSLERMATDLYAVLEKTKAKNPVLWGHSTGGMTILTFLKYNRHDLSPLRGVILQHTTYTNPLKTIILSDKVLPLQKSILEPVARLSIPGAPLLWLIKWLSYFNGHLLIRTHIMLFSGNETKKQLDFASWLWAIVDPAITLRGVLAMFRYNASEILDQIKLPVLIITAIHDKLTLPAASHTMNNAIAGSKLLTLKSAAHIGLLECHDEVNRSAEDFMNEIREPVQIGREL